MAESFNGRIIFLMFWLGGLLWFWKQWQNHFSYVLTWWVTLVLETMAESFFLCGGN